MPDPVGTGSGIDGVLGMAAETVYGTAVTPSRFYEFLSANLDVDVREIDDAGALGRGRYARSDRVTTYIAGGGGSTPMHFMNKSMGLLMDQMTGGGVLTWPGSTNASRVLTFGGVNAVAAETVTIGTTVYTFRASLSTVAFEVLIGATIAETIRNLANAINLGPGEGIWYGSLTTIHPQVTATYTATTLTATDKMGIGASANTIATTETIADAANVWAGATLTGGVNGTDTRRDHTFTPDTRGLRRKSATVQVNVPMTSGLDGPFTFPGGKIVGGKISVGLDGYLMFEPTWDFGVPTVGTALATASYAATMAMYGFNLCAVTVGGTAVDLASYEVEWAHALDTNRRFLGNTKREPLANDRWTLTGALGGEFSNRDAYDAWVAGTILAVVLTATGITIPSSASTFKVTLTLPACKYVGETPKVGGPGLVLQNRPFRVLNNGTDPVYTLAIQTSDTSF